MGANIYWADSRLNLQRPIARALTLPATGFEDYSREVIVDKTDSHTQVEKRRRSPLVSSWSLFAFIVMTTFALCVTVTMRTHAALDSATQKYQTLNGDVEILRRTNSNLARDIERLKNDPRTIENAARERLNMVRADEIVVPIK